jgi:hypothetical protein
MRSGLVVWIIKAKVPPPTPQQKEDQSSVKKTMKTPASPFEKRKVSYTAKTLKNRKALVKKRSKKDGNSEFDGNQMMSSSFSLQPTNKEVKTIPKSLKNKRNKTPKSIECLDDSDDDFLYNLFLMNRLRNKLVLRNENTSWSQLPSRLKYL